MDKDKIKIMSGVSSFELQDEGIMIEDHLKAMQELARIELFHHLSKIKWEQRDLIAKIREELAGKKETYWFDSGKNHWLWVGLETRKCIEEYRATVNMLDDLRKEKGKGGGQE